MTRTTIRRNHSNNIPMDGIHPSNINNTNDNNSWSSNNNNNNNDNNYDNNNNHPSSISPKRSISSKRWIPCRHTNNNNQYHHHPTTTNSTSTESYHYTTKVLQQYLCLSCSGLLFEQNHRILRRTILFTIIFGCITFVIVQMDVLSGMALFFVNNNNNNKINNNINSTNNRKYNNYHLNKNNNNEHNKNDNTENSIIITLVYISHQLNGLIPSIGSVLYHSSNTAANTAANKPLLVEVVIIGETHINEQVRTHFGSRLHRLYSMTLEDVTHDLEQNYYRTRTSSHNNNNNLQLPKQPIWMWPEWHSSIDNETNRTKVSWMNKNSIRQAQWDSTIRHANPYNHLRFYLPHLSIFNTKENDNNNNNHSNKVFYFLGDDVLVQKDFRDIVQLASLILDETKNNYNNNSNDKNSFRSRIGMISPCNGWVWDDICQKYRYHTQLDTILDMPALYGKEQSICSTTSDNNDIDNTQSCVPSNYKEFINNALVSLSTYDDQFDDKYDSTTQKNHFVQQSTKQQQIGWNFGFTLFHVENWKRLQLTIRYEHIMMENYKHHVFPEASLSFGLGVPYLAFAGSVQCWGTDPHYSSSNDDIDTTESLSVHDGFGSVGWERIKSTFSSDYNMSQNDVIHYSGINGRPWEDNVAVEDWVIEPWLQMMKEERMSIPKQLRSITQTTDNLFLVVGGTRTGTHWLMSELDRHPRICASGEYGNSEAGFPTDALYPSDMPWYPRCSVKRGCSYSFVRDHILQLTKNDVNVCNNNNMYNNKEAVTATYGSNDHVDRLCRFVHDLNGDYSIDSITKLWVKGYVTENKQYMGCGCARGVQAKGLKIIPDWIHYKGYPSVNSTGPAELNLNNTALDKKKIIRMKRSNLWARYKSMEIAKATNMWHVSTQSERMEQMNILSKNPIRINIDDMRSNIRYMELSDRAGDEWSMERGESVHWIEYDTCRANIPLCMEGVYKFLGIELDQSVDTTDTIGSSRGSSSTWNDVDTKSTLDYITNDAEVRQVLINNKWGSYVGITEENEEKQQVEPASV